MNKTVLRWIGVLTLMSAIILGGTTVVSRMACQEPGNREGVAQISSMEFFVTAFRLCGDFDEITFTFRVNEGPQIDAYIFTPEDYERYLRGLPPNRGRSIVVEGVQSATGDPYLPRGDYTVVIDNTSFGLAQPTGEGVRVFYDVAASFIPISDMPYYVLFGLILIAGLLIFFLSFASRIRDSDRERGFR